VPLPYEEPSGEGLAAEIQRLDPDVWSPLEKRYRRARTMVARHRENKVREAVWEERRAWREVQSLADWEKFRDERLAGLRESTGQFPQPKPPLDTRVTARHEGDGYRLENVIFQSRPNYWMTANLYLPAKPSGRMPGMVIVHSQHYPKTQGELHDMGELWARAGVAVPATPSRTKPGIARSGECRNAPIPSRAVPAAPVRNPPASTGIRPTLSIIRPAGCADTAAAIIVRAGPSPRSPVTPVTSAKVRDDIAALSWSAADCIAIAPARSRAFRRMGNSLKWFSYK
jgi:hypothetical protein